MAIDLGIIEGFYGKPWSWPARAEAVQFLASFGYRTYVYAPKGDAYLRKAWRQSYPETSERDLASFIEFAHSIGIEVGVGLSPFEIYRAFGDPERRALGERVALFDRLGVDRLAILFDDMRGDLPRLAETQAEVVHWVAARTRARRLVMCPTYYSDDPVLDRVFGQRPDDYLADLGRLLDPTIGIYWTGPQICAEAIPRAHVERVADVLRRPIDLWDNYPVNDGQRMCKYLHLRPFSGRDAGIGGCLASHGINPMNQPVLSRIPALTLAAIYRGEPMAFADAATAAVGARLAEVLEQDLPAFHDRGLDALSPAEKSRLRQRYAAIDAPAAQEIVDWLDGKSIVTREFVLTQ